MKNGKTLYAALAMIILLALSACTLTVTDAPPANTQPEQTSPVSSGLPRDTALPGISPPADASASPNPAGEVSPTPSPAGNEGEYTPEQVTTDGSILMFATEGNLAADMPKWVFCLYGKKNADEFYEEMFLRVYDARNGELLYSASYEADGNIFDPHILLRDANFDGINDLIFSEGPLGAHAHLWYHLLLWIPAENGFSPVESFYNIANPVVDAQHKVIRSFGSNSAYEDSYTIYRYEATGGSFAYYPDLQLELLYGEDSETLTYTEYRYENGVRIQESVVEIVLPADPNHPDQKRFYGPDSVWKLDDPIWYQSGYYEEDGD